MSVCTVIVHVAVSVLLHHDCVMVRFTVLLLSHDSLCYGPCYCDIIPTSHCVLLWSMLLCCHIVTVCVMVHVAVWLLLHHHTVYCYGPCWCVVT